MTVNSSRIQQPEDSAKVVLLGDSGVGKSSLALRLSRNEFRPYCESTIGASFVTKTIWVTSSSSSSSSPTNEEENGNTTDATNKECKNTSSNTKTTTPTMRKIVLKIWDTAGQEKYASLAPMYYRGAAACILVYDISSRSSFEMLQTWAYQLQTNGPRDLILAVCGNKLDLEEARQTSQEEAIDFAQSIGAFYMETSARDDANVECMFQELGKRLPLPVAVDDVVENRINLRHAIQGKQSCCYR
jgi:small GTP-binding protein